MYKAILVAVVLWGGRERGSKHAICTPILGKTMLGILDILFLIHTQTPLFWYEAVQPFGG